MFLSVDGGSTKTHILLLDDNFKLIKQYYIGPFNFGVISPDLAIADFKKNLSELDFTQIKKAVFGLSGMDSMEEENKARQILRYSFPFPVQLINDATMALSAGSDHDNAIIIIAGTGSNCLGRNAQGVTAKTSGLGWILADEGSGFSIGWDILHSAVRSFDGRGIKTILEKLVLDHYQAQDIFQLKNIINNQGFSKDKIAALTKLLPIALKQNDQVANLILENNIGQILISLRPVVNKLGLESQYFEIVLAGSLFTKNLIPFQKFAANINREYSQAKVILLDRDPVWGGLKYLKS